MMLDECAPKLASEVTVRSALDYQRHLLRRVSNGAPLQDVIRDLTQFVERIGKGAMYACILLPAEVEEERCERENSKLPKQLRLGLHPIVRKLAFSVAEKTSGIDSVVHVLDIADDPAWTECREHALAHGVRTCWLSPVRGFTDNVYGVLACFFSKHLEPSDSDVDTMAVVVQTTALLVERHSVAQTMHSTEDRHRQIFDSATDFAIIGTDLSGVVTDWNEGARRILGWEHDDVLGQPLDCIFTPEDVAANRAKTEMLCAVKQDYSPDERWHIRKSGERFWAVGQLTPLKTQDGEITGFVKILRDRTEQKRSGEQLQTLTARLESQVEERTHERDRIWRNSLDLLLEIGLDGVLHAVNPAWTSALGYGSSELIGQHFEPFVHPDDVDATTAAIVQASKSILNHFEVRLRHKAGEYKWFSWRAASENGKIYANGRDITVEKQQAAQLMQANEARLKLALDAGRMGVWEWNVHADEIIWLHGAADIHGVQATKEPQVMPVAGYFSHLHPDDRLMLSDVMTHARETGCDAQAEYRVVWSDGSVHWIEARGQMLQSGDGNSVHMVGVSTDITLRKKTEHDLTFLAAASAELAGLIDPQSTLDRLAFLSVPHFADWCAVDLLQEDGALKRVAVAHTNPEKVQLARELHCKFPPCPDAPHGVWNILRTGKAELVAEITDDMLHLSVTDSEYLSALRELGLRSYIGVPLAAHGKTMGVVTFIAAESGRLYSSRDMALAEDLAGRAAVAIENASLYEELRQSDQAKDIFLATLSHELRNPLAAISSGIQLVNLVSHDKNRVEQYGKVMERQANQLSRLVDDLMEISRIRTGKIQLQKEAVSLASVLNHAVETSRPLIEAERHMLSIQMPNETLEVMADPVRLSQVFSNVLTNAARYTGSGGKIALSVAEGLNNNVVIRIRDNGSGIAPDRLKSIFELFTQHTHPVQRSNGGLGIGLALTQGIILLHGGRIEAFSSGLGQGSEFVIWLPLLSLDNNGSAPQQPASELLSPETTLKRILVVDDNVDAAATVVELLRIFGHEVSMVHDGHTAVEACVSMKPDIVLLDIGLPGIDGYEVAHQIRMSGNAETKLIALTGWGQESDRQRAFKAGFNDHLIKPVGFEKLKQALQ